MKYRKSRIFERYSQYGPVQMQMHLPPPPTASGLRWNRVWVMKWWSSII